MSKPMVVLPIINSISSLCGCSNAGISGEGGGGTLSDVAGIATARAGAVATYDTGCASPSSPMITPRTCNGERRVTKFLTQLYTMLEENKHSDCIVWSEDGRHFTVSDPSALETKVLPSYFKSSKFSSFQRQLNYFGFRKEKRRGYMYTHDLFIRGQRELLVDIQRKPNTGNLKKRKVTALQKQNGPRGSSSSSTKVGRNSPRQRISGGERQQIRLAPPVDQNIFNMGHRMVVDDAVEAKSITAASIMLSLGGMHNSNPHACSPQMQFNPSPYHPMPNLEVASEGAALECKEGALNALARGCVESTRRGTL